MLCYSHLDKMAIILNYLANNKNWVKAYTLEKKKSSMPSLHLQHTFRGSPSVSFMYNIIYETSHQSRFDARYWMLGAGALGRPRGMVRGGRREEGSGWGTRVYLWQIHVDIWQNQYNIVKLKNKIN